MEEEGEGEEHVSEKQGAVVVDGMDAKESNKKTVTLVNTNRSQTSSAAPTPTAPFGLKRSNTSPNFSARQNPPLAPINSPGGERGGPGDNTNRQAEHPRSGRSSVASSSSCVSAACDGDVCYLCHQRNQRNIPVDFSKERQKRIEEEDKLLAQYQHLRDTEAILKEQEKVMEGRGVEKSISAFNLGVADAQREEKGRRPLYHPSFLFQKRPHTPHKFFGQAAYYNDLNSQTEQRAEKEKKLNDDKLFLEKLEQIQLAEDLAAQRESYLREKEGQKDALKRALDTQLQCLPEQLPRAVPDSQEPIFGLHDASSNEKLAEKDRREREVKREVVEAARERKKEAILMELLSQKEEEEMLKQVKKEFCEDNANRHNKNKQQRRSLEVEWLRSMEAKQLREEDENRHRMHAGQLLLDQAHVSRCNQCQRKLHNKGKTNLWKETRYVPGSRLIV